MTQKRDNAINLYMEGIRDGNARAAVTKYTGDRYTQHSTGVRDGIEGFVEFFEPFIARNPKRDIQIINRSTMEKPNGSQRISSTLITTIRLLNIGM